MGGWGAEAGPGRLQGEVAEAATSYSLFDIITEWCHSIIFSPSQILTQVTLGILLIQS